MIPKKQKANVKKKSLLEVQTEKLKKNITICAASCHSVDHQSELGWFQSVTGLSWNQESSCLCFFLLLLQLLLMHFLPYTSSTKGRNLLFTPILS